MERASTPWVLAFVLVFASAGLLTIQESAAQVPGMGNASLSGMACVNDNSTRYAYDYGYGCQGLPATTIRIQKPGLGGTVAGATDKTVTTDEGGGFSFAGLEEGDYAVTGSRVGFSTATQSVTVKGDTQTQVMLPSQAVHQAGKLVDANGKAVRSGYVNAYGMYGAWTSANGADDGSFALDVQSGFFSLQAEAPGFRPAGDYKLLDGAGTIMLTLEKIPPPDAMITGTVTDQKGRPVEGVRIDAYGNGPYYAQPAEPQSTGPQETKSAPPSGASSPSYYPYYGGSNFTFTDSQGHYKLGVYAGYGSMNVQKQGFASLYTNYDIQSKQTQTKDIQIQKYPDKTAVLKGTVRSSSGHAISNFYLSANAPGLGLYECSQMGDASGGGGGVKPMPASDAMMIAPGEPYPYPGCAIVMKADGSFEGTISPGYTIVQAYANQDCTETRDSGGNLRRDCGPEFFPWVRSLVLPDNATTQLDIVFIERPGPDATLSGYVVDGQSKTAIPHARISFSRLDGYGYGDAETDADGSYKLRLRSGLHNVYVWANDHLHWEGQIDVPAGDAPFDVELTPGNEGYGYCCMMYASSGGYVAADSAHSSRPAGPVGAPMPTSTMVPGPASGTKDMASGSGSTYEDLNGGLGPYNAKDRQGLLGTPGGAPSPGAGLLMLVALGAMVVVLRRRIT